MDDRRETGNTEYREPFPYKTYDEILSEKTRKERFHHAMVVVTGIFLMLCSIIVGMGMIWSNMPNVFHVSNESERAAHEPERAFWGLIGPRNADHAEPDTAPYDPEAPLFMEDVTEAVEAASVSVVSITAENHRDPSQTRTGSGFVLSKKGYIVTLCSLVSNCDNIVVMLNDGTCYTSFIVGSDRVTDLAVLKINAAGLVPAVIGSPEILQSGDPVIALGGAQDGTAGSASLGTITEFCKNAFWNDDLIDLLYTGIRIDPAASGGPLIGKTGVVFGLCSDRIPADGQSGTSAVIAIDFVQSIASELIKTGYIAGRPMVGIQGAAADDVPRSHFSLPDGLYVVSVPEGSAAAKAGLLAGDMITHVGDVRVSTLAEAYQARNRYRAGDTVEITFYRRGMNYHTTVCLTDRNETSTPLNF